MRHTARDAARHFLIDSSRLAQPRESMYRRVAALSTATDLPSRRSPAANAARSADRLEHLPPRPCSDRMHSQTQRLSRSLAMIVFMISVVPPKMVVTRVSAKARAIGYSSM